MSTLEHHPRLTALLGGPLGWHTLVHEAEVGSTNDVALTAVRDGTPPGLVVVADHQTAGRGRLGRPWDDASAGGDVRSLTATAVVPLPDANASLTPFAVGLSVADALRRAGASPVLKWPNDVLLPGSGDAPAKVAGILVERHAVPSGEVLLVGTGIDLDWRGVSREGEASRWTSVAESTGKDVDRGDVLADLLRGLAVWLRSVSSDPLRLLIAYRDACATIGADVRVTFPDGEVLAGRAIDLDRDGRLVLDTTAARARADTTAARARADTTAARARADVPGVGQVAITAGDVEHVRPG